MPQREQTFEKTITKQARLNYLLYLPPEYDSQESWPLIMFLHGRGERGNNLKLVRQHGPPKRIAEGDDFPFIVVSPQCPAGSYWTEELDALAALLDDIIASYNVNTRRVYLTGMSMGGRGTWFLAGRYPERFAAIAPVCGAGLSWIAVERLRNMPVWAFHGDADTVVPTYESENMVGWLRDVGNEARLTLYPGVGHDSWTQAYNTPELYEWFLSHSLQEK